MEEPKDATTRHLDNVLGKETPAPVDPALTLTYTKVRLHPEDIERILTDKLPGYIPYFTASGANFPGSRFIHIDNFGHVKGLTDDTLEYFSKNYPKYGSSSVADTVNAFFAKFANYYRIHEFVDGHGGLFLYYSSILDEQDTMDLNEVSMEKNKAINEKRAARAKAAAEAKAAKDKELADLLALARAVRDAGGAMELIQNLRKTITELEEENKKLARKNRKK